MHGVEHFIFADAGYRGADKRPELQDVEADWYMTERPSKVSALKCHPRINKVSLSIELYESQHQGKSRASVQDN